MASYNIQEAAMHHRSMAWQRGLVIQGLETKHNPLAIKNFLILFYYKQLQNCEMSAEQTAFPETMSVHRRAMCTRKM